MKLYIATLNAIATMKEERGATMPEYGLMVALIAVVCIGIVTTLGTNLQARFTEIANALGN